MQSKRKTTALIMALACSSSSGFAADAALGSEAPTESAVSRQEKSPWMLIPVLQSNPKLGTSAGAMAGYLHYFDEKSRPSIFAVTGQYTSTNSVIAGGFARTSFDEDQQRLLAGLMYGNIKNDYSDYLGSGVPLQTNTELRSFISRYLYRLRGNFFLGVQGIYQNFAINGETAFDDQIMDIVGIRPYKSGGLGLVGQFDSRNDENMPTQGLVVNLNNLAYREKLAGDSDFDVYRFDVRYFFPHGARNVLAVRQLNHVTHDAPAQIRAPVQLRGYKIGQYNGDYMSSLEVEERLRLADKWTSTLFLGLACTYGSTQSCSNSDDLYPALGAGVQYILKPKEGIVMNLEYAQGKDSNYGVYLKMGYAY